jgi:hypothetical protein
MPCIYQCRSPFGAWRSGPCPACQAEYDRHMDEEYALHVEQKAYVAFRKSEATDREWTDHLDQVAPVVPMTLLNFT